MDTKLICLMCTVLMSNICYLILAALLANEFSDKRSIGVNIYGYILGMYAISVIIVSLFVGKILKVLGRSTTLYIGMIIMAFSMIGFGFLNFIRDNLYFVGTACLLKIVQGCASSFIITTSCSIISISYPDNKEKYLGYMESISGLGLMIGPFIGSFLFEIIGFELTYIGIGLIFIILMPITKCIMPSDIDVNDEIEQLIEHDESSREFAFLTYQNIVSDKIVLLTTIVAFLNYFSLTYFEPVLAFRLMEFTKSPILQGSMFSILSIGYSVTALFVSYITDRFDNKFLMFVGMFTCGLSNFLMGPSILLPNSLITIGAGLLFAGVAGVFFIITIIPEMTKRVEAKFPSQVREASDMCSGLCNAMLGLGQMVGPIYGGEITRISNYRICCDSIGLILILYSLLYLGLCYFIEPFPFILSKNSKSQTTTEIDLAKFAETNQKLKSTKHVCI